MEKGYHKGQELTMSELGLSLEELSGQPLELFAREGARLLLTVALEEEVTGFLQCRWYQRNRGSRRGYRNAVATLWVVFSRREGKGPHEDCNQATP